MTVKVSEHESLEKALSRFRKQVQRAGILADYKRKNYFESRSERRKRKAAAAERRRVKKQRRHRA